jgi:hypothetical protein
MFSAFPVSLARINARPTMTIITTEKSASCDMVKGFLVDDASKVMAF